MAVCTYSACLQRPLKPSEEAVSTSSRCRSRGFYFISKAKRDFACRSCAHVFLWVHAETCIGTSWRSTISARVRRAATAWTSRMTRILTMKTAITPRMTIMKKSLHWRMYCVWAGQRWAFRVSPTHVSILY